jgi:DNA-binding IclR family transcriptional regulator
MSPRSGWEGVVMMSTEKAKQKSAIETVGESKPFRLPAVDRAMSLLELLATVPEGLTLSEISRKLHVPKSTTHYLTYTLTTRGYLQRTSNGHYVLGLRFADLANASVTAEINLSKLAAPTLRQIAARSNLTATMSVLRGAEAVIISRSRSFQDAGGGAWVGHHLDVHCTAQGKALIASLPDEELTRLIGTRELSYYTPKTIYSMTALRAHLSNIRATGFATNDEEQVLGIRAVAAPVVDGSGTVIASVSVRGSVGEISTSRFPELGREMIRAARYLSLQVSGYKQPYQ